MFLNDVAEEDMLLSVPSSLSANDGGAESLFKILDGFTLYRRKQHGELAKDLASIKEFTLLSNIILDFQFGTSDVIFFVNSSGRIETFSCNIVRNSAEQCIRYVIINSINSLEEVFESLKEKDQINFLFYIDIFKKYMGGSC